MAATTSTHLYRYQTEIIFKGLNLPAVDILPNANGGDRSLWVCLFTTAIAFNTTSTATGTTWYTGKEVVTSVDTAYARVPVSCVSGNTSWTFPDFTVLASEPNLEIKNAADISFAVPGITSWGTIVGAGITDALTGGNLLYYSALTTPKTVNTGDGAPKILAGQLRITRA